MIADKIKCPNCGTVIELEEAFEGQIQSLAKVEAEKKLKAEIPQMQEKLVKEAEQRFQVQLKEIQSQLSEKDKKIKEAENLELQLLQRSRQLDEKEQSLALETEKKLASEMEKIKVKHLEEMELARQKAAKDAESRIDLEVKNLQNQLTEKDKKIKEAEILELQLLQRSRQLDEKEQSLALETEKKLSIEMEKIKAKHLEEMELARQKAAKDAESKLDLEVKNLHTQLTEQNNKIKEAEDQEIELRKKTRELEEQQRQMRIEYERNYDTELRKRIDKISDDHKLKDAEKDKQLNDMQKQIEELNRKSQQASQQAQGEVLEIELENSLRQEFFYDDIKPVAKGVRGADVIQTVRGQNGMDCGTIIWEAKRTKNWQQDWIQKLKDDQRDAKANVAVIVTIAMPKDVERIRNIDGVWVCDFATYIGLATALRAGIIDVAHVRLAMQGKSEKTEMLYNYFSGNEFRQRMETILDTFITMRAELDSEKRAIMKQWAAREKQIDKITQASSFLYGDVKGIIGSALAPIDSLELPGKEVKELPFGNEEG